jgi:tripartite-type tricarboxylate transporter receptor subunit TctC
MSAKCVRPIVVLAALCAALQVTQALAAEPFPSRTIRLIVGFPPGGSTDAIARAMQPLVEKTLGQPLVIENRPGGGGVIGLEAVVKAPPDGHVIGLAAAGALAVNVSLREKMPYDPLVDLAPVTMLAHIPFLLIAPNSSFAASLGDVIARARQDPQSLSIGHGGNGTAMHLSGHLINQMAGVNLQLVPYRGSALVAQDVLAGHVPLGVVDISSSIALIQSGQIKALGVSTAQRVASLPDVPTFAETGLPEYQSTGWFGIVVPAGTPPEIITKLNDAIVTALRDRAVTDFARSVGAEPAPSTPSEFGAFIRSEIVKWSKVVAETSAKPQ